MLSSNKGGTSMNSRDQLVGGSWAIKAGSMTLGRHAIANQISQRAARLHKIEKPGNNKASMLENTPMHKKAIYN